MSIEFAGAGKRFRLSAVLVGLVLALAAFVLVTQAWSIWSTSNDPRVQPGQAIRAPRSDVGFVKSGHIPPGCRPKYGCENDQTQP